MSDELENKDPESQSDATNNEAATTEADDLDLTAEALAEASEAIAAEDSEVKNSSAANVGGDDIADVATLKSERDKYYDQWVRTQAELENYRKRVSREAELAAKFASLPLIRDLLPALDNIGRTIQAAEQTSNVNDLVQGLQMVSKQFDDVFAKHSAKPIQAVGERFDPNLHEALQQIPTNEHPPMTIVQELERGYVIDDRVIRPSKVLVAAPLPESSEDAPKSAESDE